MSFQKKGLVNVHWHTLLTHISKQVMFIFPEKAFHYLICCLIRNDNRLTEIRGGALGKSRGFVNSQR